MRRYAILLLPTSTEAQADTTVTHEPEDQHVPIADWMKEQAVFARSVTLLVSADVPTFDFFIYDPKPNRQTQPSPSLIVIACRLTENQPSKRHALAYRMWKTACPAHIQTILGHSRMMATLRYGKLTEDGLQAVLEGASRTIVYAVRL